MCLADDEDESRHVSGVKKIQLEPWLPLLIYWEYMDHYCLRLYVFVAAIGVSYVYLAHCTKPAS